MSKYAASLDYLKSYGIANPKAIYLNMPTEALYEEAIKRGEGNLVKGGAMVFKTGEHTGRSAKDKYVVREASSEADVNWDSSAAMAATEEQFEKLYNDMMAFCDGKELFVQELYAGSDESCRLNVRVIGEYAWHNMFARNMFIEENDPAKLEGFKADFTVIYLPHFRADKAKYNTRSETVIMLNFAKKVVLIGGTEYAGELKKSIFTVMNYYLPKQNIMSMHCSANIGAAGDTALFFGLSGTGKTTLSSDPKRNLIGDDEHGWNDKGVFNIEGGCYAKVIKLSKEMEPDIYKTTHTYGTILENVVFDEVTREIDLDSDALTENTRSSYPLSQMPRTAEGNKGGHPKNIIFLTYDAFGVLPPVAKLDMNQAMYHFVSGYTAKVAGTEKGVKEPSATFSTCFGEPFMVFHPFYYAKILAEKMKEHGVNAYLVNTGLFGGKYGVGQRFSIKDTRAIVNAILDGEVDKGGFHADPVFGFGIPNEIPGVNKDILDPTKGWANKDEYDAARKDLAGRFIDNFKKYPANDMTDEVMKGSPKL
ncbi:MAG: phosphoenolpyruvate carboxykinase (ATP) [Deferribacterales bacterium]|nr:phosphoenolpyruvate carboxykinase (ATP) [Deferribacterales bacterium]